MRHRPPLRPGKVQLAALVYHHDEEANEEREEETMPAKLDETNQDGRLEKIHSKLGGKQASKLARLFSKKKTVKRTTLIDNPLQPPAPPPPPPPSQSWQARGNGANLSELMNHHETIGAGQQQAGKSDRGPSQPVIEFKFDLIVDRKEGPAEGGGEPKMSKINESLDELLDSFVLQSNDVCIISTGRNHYHHNRPSQFEYLIEELGAHILAGSFELIADNCSIELSATLFLAGPNSDPAHPPTQFTILDLLRDEPELAADRQPASVDCRTLEHALSALRRAGHCLEVAGASAAPGSKVLMLALRLKQRVDGGLFSNKLCLIDFDAKFYELGPILESIFSGQALAHLKKRKHHLQALQPDRIRARAELEFERELLRAECLLYKQLSSALMKTLVLVHVHKLSFKPAASRQHLKLEQQIMADNLELLEFARSLQRASCARLKRRKKHLRSYLASSNVSLASNTSFCATGQLHARLPRTQPAPEVDRYGRAVFEERKRHRHHRHHQRCNHRASRLLAANHHSDLTESSSVSTSSGSRPTTSTTRRLDSGLLTLRRQLNEALDGHENAPSDSDSLTSAFLNSCSSSSVYNGNNNINLARSVRGRLPLLARGRFAASRDLGDSSSTSFELCSMSPTRRSSTNANEQPAQVGKIGAVPAKLNSPQQLIDLGALSTRMNKEEQEEEEDNMSDTCSVVAEPPKQLKLEEFLTKLNSVIAVQGTKSKPPSSTGENNLQLGAKDLGQMVNGDQLDADALTAAALAPDGFDEPLDQAEAIKIRDYLGVDCTNCTNCIELEEEEDCKSHSSILEHLSSLALESNNKLTGRLMADRGEEKCGALDLVASADNCTTPTTGHLQRLLNNSGQLRKANSPRVVTVVASSKLIGDHNNDSSSPPGNNPRIMPISSNSLEAFTPSNHSSSCSSSSNSSSLSTSSSSSSSNARHLLDNKLILDSQYAAVMRNNHQNVKT